MLLSLRLRSSLESGLLELLSLLVPLLEDDRARFQLRTVLMLLLLRRSFWELHRMLAPQLPSLGSLSSLQRSGWTSRPVSFSTPGRGCTSCLPRALLVLFRLPGVHFPAPGLPRFPSAHCSLRPWDQNEATPPLGCGELTEARSTTWLFCPWCGPGLSRSLRAGGIGHEPIWCYRSSR